MLTLILGRAKSGKTAKIMQEIRAQVRQGRSSLVLLVPEQYSHEAEAELLRVCGDSLSRYAEVLSFKRLTSRVEAELGAPGGTLLDKGGRLLCMALAVDAVGSRLRVFGAARRQAELQDRLLSVIDGMKSACVTPDMLRGCAAAQPGPLGDKLQDLALLFEAYEAMTAQGRLDPVDRLTRLAEEIGRSRLGRGSFWIDGFTDFTRQESEVIGALLRGGAQVTVCLTCEGLEESREIFESSRRAALALRRLAGREGVECRIAQMEPDSAQDAMGFLEKKLFSFDEAVCEAQGAVALVRAGSIGEECEHAAARCISLVRDTGCRWRDIAVAVRGYEDYRPTLESVFLRYGVPLYSAGKSAMAAKPLLCLISGAFAIVGGGWDYEDVIAYLKTGLTGLTDEECLALEDYAFLWTLRGSAWTRAEDWRMHPEGYNAEYTEAVRTRLAWLNGLRRRITQPLAQFAAAGREGATALAQVRALNALLEEIHLPESLETRAGRLETLGMVREAAEYEQLWELVVSALEQCAQVLGGMAMDQETFGRLFTLMLSKYDVGTIPLSLDRVQAGDMDRMRRRNIRHLIVLGCDSVRVPLVQPSAGVLSDEDLALLTEMGLVLGDGAEDRLCHEFALLYNCFTLPSETLSVSWCTAGGDGQAQPSFVISRLQKLFGLRACAPDVELCRTNCAQTAFELAASGSGSALSLAAAAYFRRQGRGEELERIRRAGENLRAGLSRSAVRALYGERMRLSATRIDKFASCRFAYFLQYGLRAKPRQAAGFSPPEMGTFLHYVLEHVASELSGADGFRSVTQEETDALCDKYVERYVLERLNDFRDKSARFVYLFRRLTQTVRSVVRDMVEELARSDFRPLDFELDFGDSAAFPPIEIGAGEDTLCLTGVADRVDGWLHEGKLYLRVVDYKTGRKRFSLSDVWQGMGLQMLLYLFALARTGPARYGHEVVPAGVLYVPARDALIRSEENMDDGAIASEKMRARRRSGLLLDDEAVLNAMEGGSQKQFLPVAVRGRGAAEALASSERIGLLARHIDSLLAELAKQLHAGSIAADPYFRSQADTACAFCEYSEVCRFDETRDRRRCLARLDSEEIWRLLEEEERGRKT